MDMTHTVFLRILTTKTPQVTAFPSELHISCKFSIVKQAIVPKGVNKEKWNNQY